MKILLTSLDPSIVTKKTPVLSSIFYRMPPVSRGGHIYDAFMPDYTTLLLFEKIIMDKTAFDALEDKPHTSFENIANSIKVLYEEGFVELVDFNQILEKNNILFKTMLDHDLSLLDQWVDPLKYSTEIWYSFAKEALYRGSHPNNPFSQNPPLHQLLFGRTSLWWGGFVKDITPPRTPARKRTYDIAVLASQAMQLPNELRSVEQNDALKTILKSYLSYINANLIISNELNVGLHDWSDFSPFYRHKFLYVGKENVEEQQIESSKMLFKLSFPEFTIKDVDTLIKILKDNRITDLRNLIQDAVDGKVVFDHSFAKNTLKDLLKLEQKSASYRNFISYITIPIGFIPWIGNIAQKATEEIGGLVTDKKLKERYRWFYMLSEVVENPRYRRGRWWSQDNS